MKGWVITSGHHGLVGMLAFAITLAVTPPASAQEFEPRTYSPVPVGLNFFAVAYAFSTGNVFLDPSLPFEDVDADVHVVVARYIRSVSLFDRPCKLKMVLPWSSGEWTGLVEGEPRRRSATGLGDARVVVETLFSGARRMTKEEFASFRAETLWGARLQVIAPTGDYDRTKLINLGSNRWILVPEVGFSHPLAKWSLEGAVGAWLFADNSDFFDGLLLEQDPLYVAKFHAVRSIRPGFWWAVAAGYGYGGKTYVDGIPRETIQRNWRLSALLVYPLSPRRGLSVSVVTGGNFGAGADFDAIAVSYQYAW